MEPCKNCTHNPIQIGLLTSTITQSYMVVWHIFFCKFAGTKDYSCLDFFHSDEEDQINKNNINTNFSKMVP